jgi:hypothetical protein
MLGMAKPSPVHSGNELLVRIGANIRLGHNTLCRSACFLTKEPIVRLSKSLIIKKQKRKDVIFV